MKFKFILFFLLLTGYSYSQDLTETRKIQFGLLIDGIGLTAGGFSEMNTVFSDNNIPKLGTEVGGIGFKFQYHFKKRKSAISLQNINLESRLADDLDRNYMGVVPKVSSKLFRINYHKIFNNNKKTYFDVAIGIGVTTLRLEMINLDQQTRTFSSLISNPNSSSLNFEQTKSEGGFNFSAGVYRKTNIFKPLCSSFDLGFELGYFHALKPAGGEWVINGTGNNFIPNDLPPVEFKHFFVQFSFIFTYEVKTKK